MNLAARRLSLRAEAHLYSKNSDHERLSENERLGSPGKATLEVDGLDYTVNWVRSSS